MGTPGRNGVTSHPGEPGVGPDLPPPFAARDEDTRWLFGLNRLGIRPGLVRIRGLLDDLGNPHHGLKSLVVAGTNGKGSTTRILARQLQAAGLRTMTYTSPHLLQVTERIQIEERSIAADEFAERVRRIRPLVEKHETSWFESLTALAVCKARDEGVDVLCCETGLGGRLDASNILEAEAVLLTTVGLDHQRILGETLPEIAAEKLGLLKSGVPCFCGFPQELRPQAFAAAVAAGSPCHFLDELARWEDDGPDAWRLTLRRRVLDSLPDLGSPVMRRNAALALLALEELSRTSGRELLPADPAAALAELFLPGRNQLLLTSPDWILDTAHNAQALATTLESFLAAPCGGRRFVLLGSMHDKEWPADLASLFARADGVVAAPVDLPRSRSAAEFAEMFRGWGLDATLAEPGGAGPGPIRIFDRLAEGMRCLAAEMRPEDRVLATGSCFLVAQVMHELGFADLDQSRRPAPAAGALARLRDGRKETP